LFACVRRKKSVEVHCCDDERTCVGMGSNLQCIHPLTTKSGRTQRCAGATQQPTMVVGCDRPTDRPTTQTHTNRQTHTNTHTNRQTDRQTHHDPRSSSIGTNIKKAAADLCCFLLLHRTVQQGRARRSSILLDIATVTVSLLDCESPERRWGDRDRRGINSARHRAVRSSNDSEQTTEKFRSRDPFTVSVISRGTAPHRAVSPWQQKSIMRADAQDRTGDLLITSQMRCHCATPASSFCPKT
jgi:hypothetical protein